MGATLLPAEITTARPAPGAGASRQGEGSQELDVQAVFAKLKQIGGKGE